MHHAHFWIANTTTLNNMENLLIFKTDIKSKKKVKSIKRLLDNHPVISDWSVDTNDVDNVLRIETKGNVYEKDIIGLVRTCGFYCQALNN